MYFKIRHLLPSLLMLFPTLGQTEEPKFYGPILNLNARLGSHRTLGRVELNVPLSQTKDKLLFADIRTVFGDQSDREGNVGLGYRQVVDINQQDFIVGGYGFYDRRQSEFGNYFSQITLGGELLGSNWRGRANYYLPVSEDKTISDNPDTAALTPDGFVLVNPQKFIERPLTGFDLELGMKIPTFKKKETWAHLGFYKFGLAENVTLNGARFRGETQVNDWLRLGVESSYDNVRKDNHFFDIRVAIPLQKNSAKKRYGLKQSIHKYMQEPIIRDIDIVTSGRAAAAAPAKGPNGRAEKYIFVDNTVAPGGDGTPGNPYDNLADAQTALGIGNNNKTIFVRQGDGTTSNMNTGITIDDDDARFIGSGINLTTRQGVFVEGATAAPHITNSGGDAITIAGNDIEVAGFYIDAPAADGVFSLNFDGANIHDNTIVGAGNNGINTAFTDNRNRSVTITNNTISGSVLRGITVRSFNGADITASVSGNTSIGNTQEAIRYEVGATNSTLNVTSAGNTASTSGGVAGLYAVSAGDGELTLSSSGDTANGNTQHGIFAQLVGTGTHSVTIGSATGNTNGQIGIGIDVQDSTSVTANLNNTSADSNGTDGLNIISRSDSTLNANVSNHSSTGSTDQGVDITADGTSTVLNIDLDNVNSSTSGNSGMFLRARSSGTLNATLANSTIDNNTASGLFIEGASTANTNVSIETTDITNSATFNLNLSDTTSGTYNVDLGGGSQGSAGQNRIFNSGNVDVFGNLNGSVVSAQSNWWGVSSGLDAGETNLISGGSIDASSPLAADPRP